MVPATGESSEIGEEAKQRNEASKKAEEYGETAAQEKRDVDSGVREAQRREMQLGKCCISMYISVVNCMTCMNYLVYSLCMLRLSTMSSIS